MVFFYCFIKSWGKIDNPSSFTGEHYLKASLLLTNITCSYFLNMGLGEVPPNKQMDNSTVTSALGLDS